MTTRAKTAKKKTPTKLDDLPGLDPLLTLDDICVLSNISRPHLNKMRAKGLGPLELRIPGHERRPRVRYSAYLRWIDSFQERKFTDAA